MEKPNIFVAGSERGTERDYLYRNAPIALMIGDARGIVRALEGVTALGVKTPEDFSKYLDDHPEFLELILDNLIANDANDACAKLVGARDASEVLGPSRQMWRTRPDTIRRAMESRFRGERGYRERTQIDGVDGRLVDVLCTATIADGGATLVTFVDLTELTRAEADSARLAAIVASADDAIISKDLDGIVTSWNAAATAIFGYDASEMMGKSILRVVPTELREEAQRHEERVGEGGHLRHFETLRLGKDGRRIDLSLTISPMFDKDGKVVGTATVARDIGSQSERRYRRLFEFMPIPLWQIDVRALMAMVKEVADAGVTDFPAYLDRHPDFIARAFDSLFAEQVNMAAARMFGAADRRELADASSIRRLFMSSGDTLRQVMDAFRRVLESRWRNESTFEEQVELLTSDGRRIDALVHIARIEPGVTLLAVVDLTDLLRAQRELDRIQAEFAHAARISALGELTVTIAHEVNQPLTGLVSSGNAALRWIASTPPNLPAARESIERMIEAGSRAAGVIARIRAMVAKA
ncbi:MAG: PAS domain S-box protein, partial [Vitreimonas sp.]